MKKDPLLVVLVILVGVFTYFAAFRGMVLIWMIPVLVLFTGLWYVCTAVVTEAMVRKNRKNEEFFFVKGGLVSSDETALSNGALVATASELVFYTRRSYLGGVKPVWSCLVSQIESYSLEKVDDRHDGIVITLKGQTDRIRISSRKLKAREEDFRNTIGW